MPRQLTFIHAADLHLGAPFRGLRALSPAWADRLIGAIPRAWDRIVDEAVSRSVDFVVVAGDIFDDAGASYADYRRFFAGIERLGAAGIPAYLCTGNHDPYVLWQQDFFALPENAVMLAADRPGFVLHERDGEPLCIIGGRGFLNSVWSDDRSIAHGVTRAAAERELGPHAAAAPFGVGVLHTGLHLDPRKAPADPQELLRAGFDYWALGHIHRRWIDSEENPRIAFSGCIQARDVKETGQRGISVVTLTEGAPNQVEFVPTADVVWERLSVDVSACDTIPAIADEISRAQFAASGRVRCEDMVFRVALTGATPLHDMLARPDVIEDVRATVNDAYAPFFIDVLANETTRPVDRDALREEGLFPAVLLQTAAALRDDRDAQVSYLQEEFLERGLSLSPVPLSEIDKLSAEAEELVLDLILQGGAS